MTITTEAPKEGVAVAGIAGVLDAKDAAKAGEAIFPLSKDGAVGRLILDFRATEFLSSAGLRIVLEATQNIMKRGAKLCLVVPGESAPNREVAKSLKLAGFFRFAQVFATVEEALA